jgi:Acyclic terpene utilisation family protein AtuA
MPRPSIRIGGASGFWGDSSIGAPQLVAGGNIDFLVFDYLAELTMSILAAQRLKNPEAGFALDFVTVTMKQVLAACLEKKIRIVSNAGGVNPQACAKLLAQVAAEQGLSPRIAVVTGDDVTPLLQALRAEDVREMQSGRALPERVVSANAYLGALPIKAALDAGADIVITGRCVDSAVTIGALMHAFAWAVDDYDRLAQAALAGHIIECGAQATGGLFTDWQTVPDWANIGYPIVDCAADGTFTVTKAAATGGLVTPAVVAEQILYEIGDPTAYLLPDVVCDFSAVELAQVGPQAVSVRNAKGRAPTSFYKVSSTYADGYRSVAQLTLIGFDAAAKARRTGDALLERTRALFKAQGLSDYSATRIETVGAENAYGPHGQAAGAREVIMRLAVRHPDKRALEIFAREFAAPGTSFAPGTTGGGAGRPDVAPSIQQFAFLLEKSRLAPHVHVDGATRAVVIPGGGGADTDAERVRTSRGSASGLQPPRIKSGPGSSRPDTGDLEDVMTVPLIRIAHGRSGDKGDISNIGIIARRPDLLAVIAAEVTAASVKAYLGFVVAGRVTRYALPGIDAFNFVCEEALGGGGMASLRNDPLGKAMAQILLSMPVVVPRHLLVEA